MQECQSYGHLSESGEWFKPPTAYLPVLDLFVFMPLCLHSCIVALQDTLIHKQEMNILHFRDPSLLHSHAAGSP